MAPPLRNIYTSSHLWSQEFSLDSKDFIQQNDCAARGRLTAMIPRAVAVPQVRTQAERDGHDDRSLRASRKCPGYPRGGHQPEVAGQGTELANTLQRPGIVEPSPFLFSPTPLAGGPEKKAGMYLGIFGRVYQLIASSAFRIRSSLVWAKYRIVSR